MSSFPKKKKTSTTGCAQDPEGRASRCGGKGTKNKFKGNKAVVGAGRADRKI